MRALLAAAFALMTPGVVVADDDPAKVEAHRMVQESIDRAAAARASPTDPQFRRVGLSGRLCALRDWRAGMIQAVRKEQSYADETGVVDLAKLQRLKEVIQAIDTAAYPLEHGTERLLKCADPTVARLARCIDVFVTNADTGQRYHRNVTACDESLSPYIAAATR